MSKRKPVLTLLLTLLAGLFLLPSQPMAQLKKYLKPDLEMKSLNLAYDEDGKSVLVVEMENDSHVSISYPGYEVTFSIFRDNQLLETFTPNFGEWKGERRKVFEFQVPMVAATYRVNIEVDGLVGESDKDDNVIESYLTPPGDAPPPPADNGSSSAPPAAVQLMLNVYPHQALAGSPVLVEASSHGRLEIAGTFLNAVWTKGDGVGHRGAGVSAVTTIPSGLTPGMHSISLTDKAGQAIYFEFEVLALPPKVVEFSPSPAAGKQKLTVVVENLSAERAREASIWIGDRQLSVSSSGPMKGGRVYLNTTLPGGIMPGDLRVEADGTSSDFWWPQHLRVSGVPSLYTLQTASHSQGSILLIWGTDLQGKNLRWLRNGRNTQTLGHHDVAHGSVLLLASGQDQGAVEAMAGKTVLGSWYGDTHDAGEVALVLEDFNPGSVRAGDTLVITGSGLHQVIKVKVGGGECTIAKASEDRLEVKVGKHCRTGPILLFSPEQEIESELHLVVR